MKNKYSLLKKRQSDCKTETLASPRWFKPEVDRVEIRKLMQKSDRIALRDTIIWLGGLGLCGYLSVLLWPSWWSLPIWLCYGVLYGSASDSRWHECGHRTAFKTEWLNNTIYQIASFMLLRNPVVWKASHVRHHTDTIIVGRDPEIVAMRPPDLVRIFLNIFGLIDTFILLKRMRLHIFGRLHPDEVTYVLEKDQSRVFFVARVWLGIYSVVAFIAVWSNSILPFMLIGLPRLYGAWHHVMTGLLQHLGLAENVTDHRLNTRTVLMNPISRFIYLNMNYHLEHHLFTMVPYYNLPKLHSLIEKEVPIPDKSILAAFRRLLPVLIKQLRYQDAVIIPKLPNGATPYGPEVEKLKPHAI